MSSRPPFVARWPILAFLISVHCSSGGDSSRARAASASAERSIRSGMTIADVVDVAASASHDFSVLGFCGSRARNVRGDGGDAGLIAWRGSPSGGAGISETVEPEHRFADRSGLRAGIEGSLLKGDHCSSLLVGFPAEQSWRVEVVLSSDGRVTEVKASQPWQ